MLNIDTMTSLTPAQLDTFERITPRLKRIAYSLARRDAETDPDDIFQQMSVVFWERSSKDPKFTDQKDAYILVACAHNGGTRMLRKQRVYRRYVTAIETTSSEDPNTPDAPELTAPGPTPEQVVERSEFWAELAAAVRKLAPRDQTIVKMLYLGDRPVEIAAALQLDRSVISRRQKIIREALSAV